MVCVPQLLVLKALKGLHHCSGTCGEKAYRGHCDWVLGELEEFTMVSSWQQVLFQAEKGNILYTLEPSDWVHGAHRKRSGENLVLSSPRFLKVFNQLIPWKHLETIKPSGSMIIISILLLHAKKFIHQQGFVCFFEQQVPHVAQVLSIHLGMVP